MRWKLVKNAWEQIFFAVLGLVFIAFSFGHLWLGDVTAASAIFAMSFFCFLYSNISRFKRIKGLGFEAELWDDKQKEAAQLIDRLKSIVSVYTREIIMGKIMSGRLGAAGKWADHWKLYDELVEKHSELGQEIDFGDLKQQMFKIFVFDITRKPFGLLNEAVQKGIGDAQKSINMTFGSPITDSEGYSNRVKLLRDVTTDCGDRFQISQNGDLAQHIIDWVAGMKNNLKTHFDVPIEIDESAINQLQIISKEVQAERYFAPDKLLSFDT